MEALPAALSQPIIAFLDSALGGATTPAATVLQQQQPAPVRIYCHSTTVNNINDGFQWIPASTRVADANLGIICQSAISYPPGLQRVCIWLNESPNRVVCHYRSTSSSPLSLPPLGIATRHLVATTLPSPLVLPQQLPLPTIQTHGIAAASTPTHQQQQQQEVPVSETTADSTSNIDGQVSEEEVSALYDLYLATKTTPTSTSTSIRAAAAATLVAHTAGNNGKAIPKTTTTAVVGGKEEDAKDEDAVRKKEQIKARAKLAQKKFREKQKEALYNLKTKHKDLHGQCLALLDEKQSLLDALKQAGIDVVLPSTTAATEEEEEEEEETRQDRDDSTQVVKEEEVVDDHELEAANILLNIDSPPPPPGEKSDPLQPRSAKRKLGQEEAVDDLVRLPNNPSGDSVATEQAAVRAEKSRSVQKRWRENEKQRKAELEEEVEALTKKKEVLTADIVELKKHLDSVGGVCSGLIC